MLLTEMVIVPVFWNDTYLRFATSLIVMLYAPVTTAQSVFVALEYALSHVVLLVRVSDSPAEKVLSAAIAERGRSSKIVIINFRMIPTIPMN